jgi:dienelactone hydrolase
MVVGSDDVLLEDNLAMAARLVAAGVEVDLRIYPACPHGFTGHPTPMARAAVDGIDAWLRSRLHAGPLLAAAGDMSSVTRESRDAMMQVGDGRIATFKLCRSR